MRDPREPPRVAAVGLFAILASVVLYPLHRPYLHPDQDVAPTLALVQLAQGSWSPLILHYGSAFPNLLHVIDAVLLRVGRVAGWWETPADLLAAWCAAPWLFRVPARAVAMAAGIGSLVAVRGIVGLVADRWTALIAPALLGSWIVFVREHHHGSYDAPASGAALLALWAAAVFVRRRRARDLVLAGALAGLATSFKYNLLPAVPAVLAAAFVVEPGHRLRPAVAAGLAALGAFALATPEVVLEPGRLYESLAAFIPLQSQVLAAGAGTAGNRLADTLGRGIGWSALAVAAAGVVRAAARRERTLIPVLVFVVLYGVVLAWTPLALARYALPIAGPIAAFTAYALGGAPLGSRLAATAVLVAVGAPVVVRYVRLLAVEDTRIEAARLVEAEWARGGRVVVATNPVLWMYVGPAVAQLPRYDPGLSSAIVSDLAARAPRCMEPIPAMPLPTPAAEWEELRGYEGVLIVTSDPPAPPFERASTPPAAVAVLERDATLVADLAVERVPAARDYEAFDLNYAPWSGYASLVRPGPRMRIWRVP